MIDFTEVLEKLNSAKVKSSNVMRAISRINDLKPSLVYALAEIDAEENEVLVPPTSEQQNTINNIVVGGSDDVDPLDIEAAKISVEKETKPESKKIKLKPSESQGNRPGLISSGKDKAGSGAKK